MLSPLINLSQIYKKENSRENDIKSVVSFLACLKLIKVVLKQNLKGVTYLRNF